MTEEEKDTTTEDTKVRPPEDHEGHDHSEHDHEGHDHPEGEYTAHPNADTSKKDLFTINTNHALMHLNQNDPDGAMEHFSLALATAEEMDDKVAIASTLNSIGHVLLVRGQLTKALKNYNQALTLSTEADDSQEIARSYHNLGTFYEKAGQFDKALEHLLTSLAYQDDAEIDARDTHNYIQDIRKTMKFTPFKILAQKVYDSLPTRITEKIEFDEFINDRTFRIVEPRVGRNDPCPCGSDKKYKKCCGK